MPGYVIYVDAWFVRLAANFLFEFLLLWATAEVTRAPTSRTRLCVAAGIGTLHYLLFLVASLGLIPYYGFVRFMPVVFVVSLFMILAAFYPMSRRRFLSVLGHFYIIGFASAGAGIAAAYLLGTPAQPQTTVGMFVAMVTILIIAEVGWGIVQKRICHHVYQIPVEIYWRDRTVKLNALIDTGNTLHDPITQHPVVVVEKPTALKLFPEDIGELLAHLQPDDFSRISDLTNSPEASVRFRVIPYQSIGKENGLLLAFRPDGIRLVGDSGTSIQHKVIMGIHDRPLDPDGHYQALVPPSVLEGALATSSPQQSSQKGGRSHAASTHSKI